MSGTVTVPGPSGTISLTFTGTANIGLANQIANALAAASTSGSLSVVNYTGGPIPSAAPGTTEELVLNASVSGSVTVPAVASGVSEVLVLPQNETNPVTIYGTPGLSIVGGGANVDIIDPTIIDLGNNGLTNNADLVTATFADSPYLITLRQGNETVIGSGSGTIFGSTGTDSINLTGAGSGTNNLVVTEAANDPGDIVIAGGGNVTVDNLPAAAHAQDIGGSGNFFVDDAGVADTISAGLGNTAVTAAGSSAVIFGSLGTLNVDGSVGTGNTVDFGLGGGTFSSSGASSADTIFAGVSSVSVNAANTTNDLIVGDTGALTVNAGTGSGLLVYGPISGPGLDFIGGSGSATVAAQAGSDIK